MNPESRIRDALDAGEVALGARTQTYAPAMVEVFGQLDLDFVWIDFEHGGPSADDVGALTALVRAAAAGGIEPLVRLPSGDGQVVRTALDAGVRTVLIPRVRTADEVRRAVAAARFSYDGAPGERGSASGRATGWGNRPADYVQREDAETTVGVMIENRDAVADLESILAVPELGFVFVGPGDLSVSLGHPLETDHPEVLEAIDRIRTASTDAGVPVGRIANSVDAAVEAAKTGYGIVRVGGDVAAVRRDVGGRVDAVRERID